MKRIRLIPALLLCLALIVPSSAALAASKAATTKPTIKISVPKGTMRGGVGGDLTVTPSVPGFLTLKLLTEDGVELATLYENAEVHTKANVIGFEAVDANGVPLQAGSYVLSATMVNQYGTESKETTAAIKLGDPKPALSNVTISSTSQFDLTVGCDVTFSDERAIVTLSLFRTNPKAMYFNDFPEVELTASGTVSTTLNLMAENDLASAAGYYTIRGAVVEDDTGISSDEISADFVVDAFGTVYPLADASADVLASVDAAIAGLTAGSQIEAPAVVETVAEAPAVVETVAEAPAAAPVAEAPAVVETAAEAPAVAQPVTQAPAAVQTAAAANGVTYAAGNAVTGPDGYQIGAGVSDAAEQADAGYWALTSNSSNAEIWAALTRTMIGVDVAEQESAYIYDSPEEGRKSLGTVSGLSQGLNVIKEREDGWSLVETYRNEDGAFIRGYIRTNKLRVVEPNTTYGIVVDKAAQTLTVWKDGEPIGSCAVSTGLATPKYLHRETPAGEYILVTRRGTIEYYGNGFSKNTIRFSGNYHLCEIPSTKKNGSDFSLLEGSLGQKATRGHICVAHEASSDGGINAEWIWDMTTDHKRVKLLILDDKSRTAVPVGE